ncbi:exonuclease SbcCD subunit D C-terminal domain-containing protein [Bacteroidales bacterium OttesenSCG-928-B11]|nr:exonuclease SbcCD subunit D C-terminal domain-containing protein [Bacteroidales bacterium OttesenSCG-928-B11]
MRIIHTADWHLGQTFYDHSRKKEHLHFLSWLQNTAQERGADVLLIAGDVFDSPNPSAESQKIFYRFLKELNATCPHIQVIVIAGNHDSAARLEAPNPLLETMNVSICGIVKKDESGQIISDNLIVPIQKSEETVGYVLAVPYLRQGDYPDAKTYTAGVGNLYRLLFDQVKDEQKPVIAMGHLQATGSEISINDHAERTIIGGLEAISPDIFAPEIRYTALGHLHRAQQVSKRENVRYAGAPLPMSFAEKHNKQGVWFIEVENDETHIEKIFYDTPVKLWSIPSLPSKSKFTLSEILEEISQLPEGKKNSNSPFLEVKVHIAQPEPSLRHQIEETVANKAVRLARIEAVAPQKDSNSETITFEELRTISPMEIALDSYKRKFGGEEMPVEMQELLQGIIEEKL